MEGWSEIMAQMEHGLISVDLPSLPAVHAVPQVCGYNAEACGM